MSSVGLYGQRRTWTGVDRADGQTTYARAAWLLPAASIVCLLLGDIVLTTGAFLLAHWVRFIVPNAELAALGLEQYERMGVTVAVLTSILFALHGMYDAERTSSWLGRFHLIVSCVSTALVLSVAGSFFLGDQRFSRLWFGAGWLFATTGVVAWRTLAQAVYVCVRDAVVPTSRVLIVGANRLGQELTSELSDHYHVVGYVDNGSDLDAIGGRGAPPLLGPIAQLEHLVRTHAIDQIIIALSADRREQVNRILAAGFHRRVDVHIVPDPLPPTELLPRRLEVHQVAGRAYITFASMAKVSWLKRVVDVALVGVGVALLAPLLALIALAIKIDSEGPIFYLQERVGKDGRRFRMMKFRSMRPDADRQLDVLRNQNEATGPLFKMRQDPRVTRVGRVLRRWSLDELPQLFNVLKGEMSLVGPRPPIPAEVEQYEDWEYGRLRAVPGITGLWQVSGRSEVSFPEMVRLDLHYIRNWSLGLDLEILLRTIPAVLSARGAY